MKLTWLEVIFKVRFWRENSNFVILEADDWKNFIYCNTNQECVTQSPDGSDSYCTEVDNVYNANGDQVKGVCVPTQCSETVECPPVGDTCTTGTIYGACSNDKCLYDPIRLIGQISHQWFSLSIGQ